MRNLSAPAPRSDQRQSARAVGSPRRKPQHGRLQCRAGSASAAMAQRPARQHQRVLRRARCCGGPSPAAPAAGNSGRGAPARLARARSSRRASVTLASTMNGENTSTGNHQVQSCCSQPIRPSAAARKPSGTEPASPMKMRAGWKLNTRNAAAAAAMLKLTSANSVLPASQAATP